MHEDVRHNSSGRLMGRAVGRAVGLCLCLGALAFAQIGWAQEDMDPAGVDTQVEIFGYDDGLFVQTSNKRFLLKTNGLLQVRLQAVFRDEGPDQGRFSVTRGRLAFGGHVFSRKFGYGLQVEFGGGDPHLLDYYVDFILVRRTLHVMVGQAKKPFGRQFLTYEGKLELGELSAVGPTFGAGRDIGVTLHNDFKRASGFEWAVGMYNGTGIDPVVTPVFNSLGEIVGTDTTNVPSDYRPELVLRAGYNRGDIDGYAESDLAGGPFRWAVGASLRSRFDAPADGFSDTAAELDLILKGRGWSFVTGEYIMLQAPVGSAGLTDQTYWGWGTYNQLSYTFRGKHTVPLRWALIDPDGKDNANHELLIGYNLHVVEHRIQWQLVGGMVYWDVDPSGVERVIHGVVRGQMQFGF